MTADARLKKSIKRALATKGYQVRKLDRLTYLADLFGSDKGTRYGGHWYTRIYSKFFNSLQNEELTILEIGLHRPEADRRRDRNAVEGLTTAAASTAPSLEMWKAYFPNAEIFGFDIDDFSNVKMERCKIVRGDMSSRVDLAELVRRIGRPIDIVIEDASHTSHHQQIALGFLFPHIRSRGLYVIEDLNWQDAILEKSDAFKTRDILRRFQVDGTIRSVFFTSEEQVYIQENVSKVHLFDTLSLEAEDPTDALGVIEKK